LLGAGAGGAALKFGARETNFPAFCTLPSFSLPAPAGWQGKTALFITDVHYGNFFGPKEARALNTMVARLQPDLVLMGGDLAQTPQTDLSEFFVHWSPACPVLFAPGNHDLTRRSKGSIMHQARESGVTVLCNTTETWGGLTFIGLPSALRAEQRISLLKASGLKIVIGHEPDEWDRYVQPDLVHLAGHTHGGQVRFFNRPICLPALGQKYPLGKYSKAGNCTLIVSAGIGCTDVPARVNCPPQIVRLKFT
ncbi:MAG TPA: metallophosphoesterase, partial [Verrucomicrobiae bacterium]|nr:metallophosphoesterase [Verrucomicrobiae bacterium]